MLARLWATHLPFYCLWALSVVKLCRPLGTCHVVKSRFTCTFTHICWFLLRKYASTYIHSFSSSELPKNILLLIRERIAKNISVSFPCEINARVILVTTTCYIISWDECSKKRYEEIKRGKCPEPRKKREIETRGKNGQVSDSRIRGKKYPHERKEKKYRASHSPQKKASKCKKGIYLLKRAKVELDFHHCYHHHHHTPFTRHTCTSRFDLLTCSSRSMVWLCNKCLVSMYYLSPTYELQISKHY